MRIFVLLALLSLLFGPVSSDKVLEVTGFERSAKAAAFHMHPSLDGSPSPSAYDIGSPTVVDFWVDPVNGDDGNSGEFSGSGVAVSG